MASEDAETVIAIKAEITCATEDAEPVRSDLNNMEESLFESAIAFVVSPTMTGH